ncbi:MAG: hypothetical protein QGH15_20525 [Kiritimatiellia bacterium]|nr:hypothetical protein [Kiritimatiellia bacterium]
MKLSAQLVQPREAYMMTKRSPTRITADQMKFDILLAIRFRLCLSIVEK